LLAYASVLRQLVSESGFSCSFRNVINHGRSTGDENCGFNRTINGLIADAKALSDQMVALTTTTTTMTIKVDGNDANNNNRNNQNRRGEPISVIRVRNNNHTTHMYRKLEHTRESDLEYYERRYYNKLKDDYYDFKISDSIYHCPFFLQ